MFNKLRILTKIELARIANKLIYTHHSKEKIYDRLGLSIAYYKDALKIRKKIILSRLAFVNLNNMIYIALNKNSYLVISQDYSPRFICVTVTEELKNGYTIYDKYRFAEKGIEKI